MTRKRLSILAGVSFALTLGLAAAGLALAADPLSSPGMMGGSGAGMMGGSGAGMMGGDQLQNMDELHDQMIATGKCDPAQMRQFQSQTPSSN